MKTVEILNGVTIIGPSAFRDFKNLTSADIPNSLKTIGEQAF